MKPTGKLAFAYSTIAQLTSRVESLTHELAANETMMRKSYEQGWCNAASWANRQDLLADMDSAAYAQDMASSMQKLNRASV